MYTTIDYSIFIEHLEHMVYLTMSEMDDISLEPVKPTSENASILWMVLRYNGVCTLRCGALSKYGVKCLKSMEMQTHTHS